MQFPAALDSTMIAAWRSCPTKCRREFFEHWKPRQPSIHLHAGAAFARGLEVTRRAFYEEGTPAEDAIATGLGALLTAYGDFDAGDSAKSLERMAGAFEFYFASYPLETDHATPVQLPGGKRCIEFSFAEPLPLRHPQSGDPLIYCGRADMVADFAGGVYIFDDKTTSSLGPSWARQWDLRSQFTGYCWAAQRAGIPATGALIRGVSILKTKYDTQQAISNRAAWEIERWYEQLLHDVRQMIAAWETGWWSYNLDHSCTEYGGCPFTQACKSPDPQPWLELYFIKRIWDPLARTETEVQS